MKKTSLWFAVALLLAANGVAFAGSTAGVESVMSVKQCGCIYGGGPGGPAGPGTAACVDFFQSGCQNDDECGSCPTVE